MQPKEAIYIAIGKKSDQYPWMETFYITDQEIMALSNTTLKKRAILRCLKSLKPVLTLHETQWYNHRKIRKYAFNSWKLGPLVKAKRNLDNPKFIKEGMREFLNLAPVASHRERKRNF